MSIQRFFDKSVVVRRLRAVSGGKKSFQATATAEGAIQEMDRTDRISSGFATERAWMAWFPIEQDIVEGDSLTRSDDGKSFKVIEVTKKDYGINEHLEVVMVEYNG